MMRPLSTKKMRPIVHSADAIKQTVAQALLSDDAACATLLEGLVGFEKEVVDVLVLLLKTFSASKVNLGGPISKIIRKHFALIGAETATTRFKEFCDNILNISDPEYASNYVFLLCQLIAFSNIMRYEKLRNEVSVGLPVIIKTLWKNNMRSEACKTARLFAELLLCVSCYQEEHCLVIWFKHVLREDTKRYPYFAALSILLNSLESCQSTDIIPLDALQELPSHKEQHMCLRSQMADLILSYFSSFCKRCTQEQLQVFVDYVLNYGLETNSTCSVLNKLTKAVAALADDSLAFNLIGDSIIRLFSEKLLAKKQKNSTCKLNMNISIGFMQNLEFHEELDKRKEKSSEKVVMIFHKKLDQKWTIHVDSSVRSLIAAFCGLPLRTTVGPRLERYLAAVMLFASVIKYADVNLFGTCIRFIGAIARNLCSIPSKSSVLYFLFEDWTHFLEEVPNVVVIREDVTSCLAAVAATNESDSSKGDLARFSPVLNFLDVSATDIWTWGQVIRLSVVLKSTKWSELFQHEGKELDDILEKIHTHFTMMLSNIAWKDNDAVRDFSEMWSLVYSCWDCIPRSIRHSTMKKLLNEKDMKILRKLATHVVKGKVEAHKTLIEGAINFYLRYFPVLYQDMQSLEDILNWNSLIQMHRASASLDVLLEQLSAQKILELLTICCTCDDNAEECLIMAEILVIPKLKIVGSDALVLIGMMFEKFTASVENTMRLLPLAAKSLEVFGHTDVEREVVSLCFGLISVLRLGDCGFEDKRNVLRILENAIRYAYPSVNNDQCSIFAELLIKVFKAVQNFITNHNGTTEEVDELVHSLNSLCHALTVHKIYYSRMVGAILSAVMCPVEEMEFAIYKLHSICDKHSTSMLATNLPPSERLKYKRLFTTIKRTRKLVA